MDEGPEEARSTRDQRSPSPGMLDARKRGILLKLQRELEAQELYQNELNKLNRASERRAESLRRRQMQLNQERYENNLKAYEVEQRRLAEAEKKRKADRKAWELARKKELAAIDEKRRMEAEKARRVREHNREMDIKRKESEAERVRAEQRRIAEAEERRRVQEQREELWRQTMEEKKLKRQQDLRERSAANKIRIEASLEKNRQQMEAKRRATIESLQADGQRYKLVQQRLQEQAMKKKMREEERQAQIKYSVEMTRAKDQKRRQQMYRNLMSRCDAAEERRRSMLGEYKQRLFDQRRNDMDTRDLSIIVERIKSGAKFDREEIPKHLLGYFDEFNREKSMSQTSPLSPVYTSPNDNVKRKSNKKIERMGHNTIDVPDPEEDHAYGNTGNSSMNVKSRSRTKTRSSSSGSNNNANINYNLNNKKKIRIIRPSSSDATLTDNKNSNNYTENRPRTPNTIGISENKRLIDSLKKREIFGQTTPMSDTGRKSSYRPTSASGRFISSGTINTPKNSLPPTSIENEQTGNSSSLQNDWSKRRPKNKEDAEKIDDTERDRIVLERKKKEHEEYVTREKEKSRQIIDERREANAQLSYLIDCEVRREEERQDILDSLRFKCLNKNPNRAAYDMKTLKETGTYGCGEGCPYCMKVIEFENERYEALHNIQIVARRSDARTLAALRQRGKN